MPPERSADAPDRGGAGERRAREPRTITPPLRLEDTATEARRPFPRTETHQGRLRSGVAHFLPSLSEAAREEVVADTRRRTLPTGAKFTLVDRGTTTAAMVICGRLIADDGDRRLQLGPGALLNARALLASPEYPVRPDIDLHALRPTRVALLPRARLHERALGHAGVAGDLLKLTDGEEMEGVHRPATDALECESIAVIRLSGSLAARNVARRLGEALTDYGTVASGDVERIHVSSPRVRSRSTAFVERQELRHRFVLLSMDSYANDEVTRVLAEADRIVFVADADPSAADAAVRRILWQKIRRAPGSVHLALVHSAAAVTPSSVAWARHAVVDVVHNLRGADGEGLERLARMLAGRASAVVLTGPDARAWAGLGVLDALVRRERVPDVVCGAGLGADAARMFASGHSVRDVLGSIRRSTRRALDLIRPPTAEVLRGRLEAGLAETLGDLAMVDCWRPCITLDDGPPGIGIPPSLPALLDRLALWCTADRIWVVKSRDPAAGTSAPRAESTSDTSARHRTVEIELGSRTRADLRAVDAVSAAARKQMSKELTQEASRVWSLGRRGKTKA